MQSRSELGMRRKIFGWLLCGALSVSNSAPSLACAFHGYTPNPTLVDLLMMTEQVVIADIDPSQPNRYRLLEVLMGPHVSDIPITVSASVTKTISQNPSARVLLARDGPYGPWQMLKVLDNRLHHVLSHVIERQSALINGGDEERLTLFVSLLNDPSPDVHQLALQELDRAPYSALQKLIIPNIAGLKQEIETGDEGLMPIRVLLAGLTKDQSYKPFMMEELAMAVEGNVSYMGAYATALIELGGTDAVQYLIDEYLTDKAQPLDSRIKILEALSLQHKNAERKTRRAIARGVAHELHQSPELKEPATRFFGFRIR